MQRASTAALAKRPCTLAGFSSRLKPLRNHRGAALPGHTLVVYDPDLALVVDILACEDAHQNEQKGALQLVSVAKPQQLWVGDRNFCTGALLRGWQEAGASFLVREHAGSHPRVRKEHPWQKAGKCESGTLQQQIIEVEGAPPWRRIRLTLDQPTESGHTHITLWTNLPEEVTAAQIAQLYRKRWRIEGMFGRLESVLETMALNGILFVLRTGIHWKELPGFAGRSAGLNAGKPAGRLGV